MMNRMCLLIQLLIWSSPAMAQVRIGTEEGMPEESAGLHVDFDNRGFAPPRLTAEQRDLIESPAEGLMIFNLTSKCIEFYAYDSWHPYSCGECLVPPAPSAGSHIASHDAIDWSWTDAPGASGYKWNVSNDYETASDLGNAISLIQTGLVCNTSNFIYVWAYNSCGKSEEVMLSQVTSECPCGSYSVTFTYNGETVIYGTIPRDYSGLPAPHSAEGTKCWLDRNLGATQVAVSGTDHLAYGDLFQWGRNADGHQRINWTGPTAGSAVNGQTTSLSPTDTPGHGDFITNSTSPRDWRTDNNNNRWYAVPMVNNPCPPGWRIPTRSEWHAEQTVWANTSSNNAAAAFAGLKLPMPGSRQAHTGVIGFSGNGVGATAGYWSNSMVYPDGVTLTTGAWRVYFNEGSAFMQIQDRACGSSVRCIKE